jgi:FkbM family methyltransferase
MKHAISGYWKLFRNEGFSKTFSSFYDYYYTKYKLKKIKQSGNNLILTHGCKMKVNPNDDGLSAELLVHGSHEPDTTKFVSKYLKENIVCVDVGANIGYYSTLYSKIVGRNGKVLAIEPSPVNFGYLKENLELQNFDNYLVFNCASGDKECSVRFLMDKRANKCMIVQDENESSNNTDIISVPVRKIDDIIDESKVERVDFLKMDVEGYEWFAIQGALKTIQKFRPSIQIEIHFNKLGHETTQKILTILKNENYQIIYHDIRSDQRLSNESESKKHDLDDFINRNVDLKSINSYKLILENVNNSDR